MEERGGSFESDATCVFFKPPLEGMKPSVYVSSKPGERARERVRRRLLGPTTVLVQIFIKRKRAAFKAARPQG